MQGLFRYVYSELGPIWGLIALITGVAAMFALYFIAFPLLWSKVMWPAMVQSWTWMGAPWFNPLAAWVVNSAVPFFTASAHAVSSFVTTIAPQAIVTFFTSALPSGATGLTLTTAAAAVGGVVPLIGLAVMGVIAAGLITWGVVAGVRAMRQRWSRPAPTPASQPNPDTPALAPETAPTTLNPVSPPGMPNDPDEICSTASSSTAGILPGLGDLPPPSPTDDSSPAPAPPTDGSSPAPAPPPPTDDPSSTPDVEVLSGTEAVRCAKLADRVRHLSSPS